MKYQEVKEKIEAESQLSPGKRTQQVPCAYCKCGGNGDKSCWVWLEQDEVQQVRGMLQWQPTRPRSEGEVRR